MKTSKPPQRKAPEPLLDPANLRASDQQMRAMMFLMELEPAQDPLVARIKARMQMVQIHRQILVQLTGAFLTRATGRSPGLTGLERTQLCAEAWNLMNASNVFVTDFVASVEIHPSVATEICANLDADADELPERVQVAVEDEDEPGPDAMPEILNRPRFDATGVLVGANPEE